jgi:hypothetical protein
LGWLTPSNFTGETGDKEAGGAIAVGAQLQAAWLRG